MDLLAVLRPPVIPASADNLEQKLSRLNFLPNQAAYVCDTLTHDLIYQSAGFKTIFNARPKEINSLSTLYDMIHPKWLEITLSSTKRIVQFVFSSYMTDISSQFCQLNYSMKLAGGNQKMILREGWIFHTDVNGTPTHYLCIMTDVSHFSLKSHACRFFGPNAQAFQLKDVSLRQCLGLLSARELEILQLIAKGYSSKQIGSALYLSIHTVNTHRRNMMCKMESSNVAQLVRLASDLL